MPVPSVLKNYVLEIPNFVTPEFCHQIIQRASDLGFHAATITSEKGTAVTSEIRNNDRVIFDDAEFAKQLWQMIEPHFEIPFKGQQAVGVNERFRIYRYGPGQYFDWHQDGVFKKTEKLRSKFTVMVYLNDGFKGGGTSFADVFSPHTFKDFVIEPATGKALMFHHPLSHRGDAIKDGTKFVLRTDVMFRPVD